jgi:serine phosphatase RsbU (regulator of sigma subunit)
MAAEVLKGEIRAADRMSRSEDAMDITVRMEALRRAGLLFSGWLDDLEKEGAQDGQTGRAGATGATGATGTGALDGSCGKAGQAGSDLSERLARLGVELAVIRRDPGDGSASGPVEGCGAGDRAVLGAKDASGKTVSELGAEEDLPENGRFYLFTEGPQEPQGRQDPEPQEAGGEGQSSRRLLGFMCLSGDGRRAYVFFEDLTFEAGSQGRDSESVLAQAGARLKDIPLGEQGFVAIFSGDGRLLLFREAASGSSDPEAGEETVAGSVEAAVEASVEGFGEAAVEGSAEGSGEGAAVTASSGDDGRPRSRPRRLLLPDDLRSRARAQGFTEERAFLAGMEGEYLLRAELYRPLDWYITLAVPAGSMNARSRSLAFRVGLAALLAVLVGAGFALVSARLLSQGLLSLERRVSEAEGLDLGGESAEAFFQSDELTLRRDEVGRLAGAMDRMGAALVGKIREAVEAAKAREKVSGELSAAREIQLGMLPSPKEAPKSPGFDAAAALYPAKEVGGDLYDFFTAPCGRRCLAIGDVSDKGVPAALFMSMVVTLVRGTVQSGLQPEEAMSFINEQLNLRNPGSMFVTLVIGLFDASTGVFTYANAGHNPPAAVLDGQVRFFPSDSPDPLAGAWPGVRYRRREEILEDGELCLLYTDGVTEAQDAQGAFFGAERLSETLASGPDEPEEAVEELSRAVEAWRGAAPQSDDITMLAFRRKIP